MNGAKHNPHEAAAELVKRAQLGDHAAFGELVRRYRERIVALVLHLTGSESDADDITQEVFLGAYRALPEFAGRSEFFTWVYRIAVNKAHNARRARNRLTEVTLEDPRIEKAVATDALGDPVRAAELRLTYSRLLQALDCLPAEMCTTVVLVALQGMSHAEAAVIQECSEGTIAWRIHKARAKLERALRGAPVRSIRWIAGTVEDGGRRRRTTDISPELSRLLIENGLPVGATN